MVGLAVATWVERSGGRAPGMKKIWKSIAAGKVAIKELNSMDWDPKTKNAGWLKSVLEQVFPQEDFSGFEKEPEKKTRGEKGFDKSMTQEKKESRKEVKAHREIMRNTKK